MREFGRKSLGNVNEYRVSFPYNNASIGSIKLDANESTYCHDLGGVNFNEIELNRYPDPDARALCVQIADTIGVDPNWIIVGNGSDEIINNLMVCFAGTRMLIPDVTYPVYSHFADIYDVERCVFPLTTPDFELPSDLESYYSRYKPSISFFSYPNNPTGNCFAREDIESVIARNRETLFIVDEAYYDFSAKTLLPLVKKYENLAVLRTFSKGWSLAGLRLGYLVANDDVVRMLKKVRLPYNLSSITQTIAANILAEGKSTVDEYIDRTVQERAWLKQELRKHPAFSVVSSEANFVFFKVNIPIDAITLKVGLNEHDVYLRIFEYPGRGVFIRFTVGEHSQNISALNALVLICRDNVREK